MYIYMHKHIHIGQHAGECYLSVSFSPAFGDKLPSADGASSVAEGEFVFTVAV